MQKKIIALAIAGLSSAAFAQTNVTISGNIDLGYQNVNTQTAAAGKDTQQSWVGNGSSTSTLVFQGTEDLGGGMKAGFLLASDYTAGAQQASGVGATTVPAAANAPFVNQMFNSQNYLMLSGNFGTFKFGTVNHTSLEAEMGAQPFGTAIGSGVSAAFSRLNGIGTAGNIFNNTANATGGARMVRAGQSMKYDTPTFSGFTGTYNHVFKNDNDQYSNVGMQEFGLKYNNGPANVWLTTTKLDSGNNTMGVAGAATAITQSVTKHNIIAGNYTFGPATVYAGWTSSKQDLAAGNSVDARSWNIAVKYAVSGALSLAANVLRVDDKRVTDVDRNLNALGVDYSLSKRSTAYVRYETGDNDKGGVTGNNTGAFTRWAVGARHTF
jgi:predicted porin